MWWIPNNSSNALRHVSSLAVCQHLSGFFFPSNPACRDATRIHLLCSDVYCYFTWSLKCVRKKELGGNGGSITKASLFEQPNCLWKYCHGESQRWMAHLFFPFRLTFPIFPWSQHPSAALLGGLSIWKQKIQKGHLVFKTFHAGLFKPLDVVFSINPNCWINELNILRYNSTILNVVVE